MLTVTLLDLVYCSVLPAYVTIFLRCPFVPRQFKAMLLKRLVVEKFWVRSPQRLSVCSIISPQRAACQSSWLLFRKSWVVSPRPQFYKWLQLWNMPSNYTCIALKMFTLWFRCLGVWFSWPCDVYTVIYSPSFCVSSSWRQLTYRKSWQTSSPSY